MDRELRDLHRGAREERRRLAPNPGPIEDPEMMGETDRQFFPCDLCGTMCDGRGAALRCCSEASRWDR